MTCNTERPSATDLFTRYQNLFQNTVLGGATAIPESNEWYAIAMNYAVAEDFHAVTEQTWKERDPRQACCENLIAMAARDGVYPRAATPAQGYLKLSGTALAPLPSPLTFTVGTLSFVTAIDTTQPTALNDAGAAVIRVRAVDPGASGNIVETTGNMDTAVANVDAAVEVCGNSFCSGSDAEECEPFRARYIARLKYQPRATNAWITEKLLEWPCSTRVIARAGTCCQCGCEDQIAAIGATDTCQDCGCVECGGKMEFYLMFDNSFDNGIAPDSIVTEAQDWLFGSPQGFGLGQVEIGVCGRIVPVTAVPVDVIIDIVDCPTSAELAAVDTIVAEFFQTVEPSQSVSSDDLRASILRTLGSGADVDVRLELVNAVDGYGASYGPADDDSKVYVTGCSLEPDCDYILTPNSTTITRTSDANTGCP